MSWSYATQKGSGRQTFTVPATVGGYAPEVLMCVPPNSSASPTYGEWADVGTLTQIIEAMPSLSSIEVDALQPGSDPAQAGSWIIAIASNGVTGLKTMLALGNWRGIRVRAKSGGVAGSAIVSATWA